MISLEQTDRFLPIMKMVCRWASLLWLVLFCRSADTTCRVWSERGDVARVGDFIFCECYSSDMHLRKVPIVSVNPFREMDTETVNNNTIKAKITTDLESAENFTCGGTNTKINIVPLLNIQNFECRLYLGQIFGWCSFTRVGNGRLQEETYFMSANESPRANCTEMPHNSSRMICYPIWMHLRFRKHDFRIEMEYLGDIQKQEFVLENQQFLVENVRILDSGSEHFCGCSFEEPQDPRFICESTVKLLNPKIDWDRRIRLYFTTPYNNTDNCNKVQKDLLKYQSYEMRISCPYYNTPKSPFSRDFITMCRSWADLPDIPPELLPNGYFYEPESRGVYIFWNHLNELQWNGPEFGYTAMTKQSKMGVTVGNTSALFLDWDDTQPATVKIWSKNSKGRSRNFTELKLPIFASSHTRLPRSLLYNDKDTTLSWKPPSDENNLEGYTVYWCSASTNILQICDEKESIKTESVNSSQLQFSFPTSMASSNMAVAARYKDQVSGGMQWKGPRWTDSKLQVESLDAVIILSLAPIIVSIVLICIFFGYQKYKKMSNIRVELPDGLLTNLPPGSSAVTAIPDSTAVPRKFPPRAINNFECLTSQARKLSESQVNAKPKKAQNGKESVSKGSYSSSTQEKCFKEVQGDYCEMTHFPIARSSAGSCSSPSPDKEESSMASGSYSLRPIKENSFEMRGPVRSHSLFPDKEQTSNLTESSIATGPYSLCPVKERPEERTEPDSLCPDKESPLRITESSIVTGSHSLCPVKEKSPETSIVTGSYTTLP